MPNNNIDKQEQKENFFHKFKDSLHRLKQEILSNIENFTKAEKLIFSKTLGYIDSDHILFFSDAYSTTYKALEKALSSKKESNFQLFPGNRILKYELNFKIKKTNNQKLSLEQKHEIIRELLIYASFICESKNIKIKKNQINKFFYFMDRNSFSNYSIEDLPSNGLGMFAMEEYLKNKDDFLKKHANPNIKPQEYSEQESAIINFILSFTKNPQKNVSLGKKILIKNKTFLPKINSLDFSNPALKYLQKLNEMSQHITENTKKIEKYGVECELVNAKITNKLF